MNIQSKRGTQISNVVYWKSIVLASTIKFGEKKHTHSDT